MKTSELIGPALDWAVAKCENTGKLIKLGYVYEIVVNISADLGGGEAVYTPSTNWSQGGPIVEREIDQISRYEAYPDYRADRFATDDYEDCHAIGPTMLIAAMRCYVASKLGDEVDIPEELL